MTDTDRALAERTLNFLCAGSSVNGIRFGSVLQMLIETSSEVTAKVKGQIYLNLTGRWIVLAKPPHRIADAQYNLPDLPLDVQIAMLCMLREEIIEQVRVGEEHPDLLIYLASGKLILVDASDTAFECWDVGVSMGDSSEAWRVVAGPDDELVVWIPQWFRASAV